MYPKNRSKEYKERKESCFHQNPKLLKNHGTFKRDITFVCCEKYSFSAQGRLNLFIFPQVVKNKWIYWNIKNIWRCWHIKKIKLAMFLISHFLNIVDNLFSRFLSWAFSEWEHKISRGKCCVINIYWYIGGFVYWIYVQFLYFILKAKEVKTCVS